MRAQDFCDLTPEKFQNKTNGVTPRRWLAWCNPGLASLITETLGTDAWINETTLLAGLRQYADDKGFQAKWRQIKHDNKDRLAAKIKARRRHPSFLLNPWPCHHWWHVPIKEKRAEEVLARSCRWTRMPIGWCWLQSRAS